MLIQMNKKQKIYTKKLIEINTEGKNFIKVTFATK